MQLTDQHLSPLSKLKLFMVFEDEVGEGQARYMLHIRNCLAATVAPMRSTARIHGHL